jgi:hypothetical protein
MKMNTELKTQAENLRKQGDAFHKAAEALDSVVDELQTPGYSQVVPSHKRGRPTGSLGRVKRVLSVAARRKISEAQKKRWAKINSKKGPVAVAHRKKVAKASEAVEAAA